MRKIAVIGLVSFALTACSPQQPTHADPTGGPLSDTDGIIARFTNDIWPAINAYNGTPTQASPGSKQLHAIIDPSLRSATGTVADLEAYSALRAAVQGLGQASRDSVMSGNPFRDASGLRLGSAVLTELNPPVAILKVCYTYSLTDRDHAMPPQPTASEITVELHKTDAWYLHAITNDHVVPGCGAVNS